MAWLSLETGNESVLEAKTVAMTANLRRMNIFDGEKVKLLSTGIVFESFVYYY